MFVIKRVNVRPTIISLVFSTKEKAETYIQMMLPFEAVCPDEGWTYNIEYEIIEVTLDPIPYEEGCIYNCPLIIDQSARTIFF